MSEETQEDQGDDFVGFSQHDEDRRNQFYKAGFRGNNRQHNNNRQRFGFGYNNQRNNFHQNRSYNNNRSFNRHNNSFGGGNGHHQKRAEVSIQDYIHPSMWEDPWENCRRSQNESFSRNESHSKVEEDSGGQSMSTNNEDLSENVE